jgi:PAS domain S-box-containing protein
MKANDRLVTKPEPKKKNGALRAAHEQLLESESRYRRLFEAAKDGILILNGTTGEIEDVNPFLMKALGFSHAKLMGKQLWEIGLFKDIDAAKAAFQKLKAEKYIRYEDLPLETKDGRPMWVEFVSNGYEVNEREVFQCNIRDITERKQAQDALISASKDISAYRDLQRQLEEANRDLTNAILAKDRFLATMSHELRTPLNAVMGFTGTLLMELPGPLNPEQRKQLETIKSSAKHQLSLINDLLDLAKIESGKVELKLEPVNCAAVVNEVADTLRPLAEEKGLEFEVNAREDIVTSTDRRSLSQILINLISNAIKFTEKGRIKIDISKQNGVTRVSVTDSGVGIRREDQTKLFAAFTRLESSAVAHEEGTGLGLHVSQKLARLLGGHITFQSEPGKGSIFTFLVGVPKS